MDAVSSMDLLTTAVLVYQTIQGPTAMLVRQIWKCLMFKGLILWHENVEWNIL